jgi:hypothetical protein
MNDRLIKQILSEEYFTKKPKEKHEIRPLPSVFNPRPKFFVFGKISKQTNFLQNEDKTDKIKLDDEEDHFGLVKHDKIIANELNTIKVYQSHKKQIEKKSTMLRKPTKKTSNDALIDLDDNYINDPRYFVEKL